MTSWPKPNAGQVASILRQKGFVIKKDGAEIICECKDPSHQNQEKDPTLCVCAKTGAYTCQGGKHSGRKSGDFYDLAVQVGEKPEDWAREVGVELRGDRPIRGKARPRPADDMRGFLPEHFERFNIVSGTDVKGFPCWVFEDGLSVVKESFRVDGCVKVREKAGSKKQLWPALDEFAVGEICYVTEGRFDALAIMAMTDAPAYAMSGSVNLKLLDDLFKRYSKIAFAYDKDEAGDESLDLSLQAAIKAECEAWVLPLLEGWDPNDLLIAGLPMPEIVKGVEEILHPELILNEEDKPYRCPKNLRLIIESRLFASVFGEPWLNSMGRVLKLGDKDYLNVHAIQFRHWISETFHITWSKDEIHDTFTMVAYENQSSPVEDYLEQLRWDGECRLGRMLDVYFTVDEDEDMDLKNSYMKKWMISAAARGLDPGCKVDSMIVLVSPKQGIGKSSFARSLGGSWFTDVNLDPESKDCVMVLHKHWVAEAGELDATTRKKDMAHLRSFLSRQEDEVRVPYGRVSESFRRGFVFIGTTNDIAVIREKEARRYWPIKVESIDYLGVGADRDQLWAEAVHLYKEWVSQGKVWGDTPWVLSSSEESLHREDTAKKFSPIESIEEVLTQWIEENEATQLKSGGYKFKDFTEFLKTVDLRRPDWKIREVLEKIGMHRGSGRAKRYLWFRKEELFD